MRKAFILLFVLIAVSTFSQDISGEWVSEKVGAFSLKNESASRIYSININKKAKSLQGESKIYFKSKEGFLKTLLFGTIDTLAHAMVLHTENMRSSIDGTQEHMKDNNKYNWTYSADSIKEYLMLVRDEEFPHILLDSNIVFSRVKTKVEVPPVQPVAIAAKKGDTTTKIHPVVERKNRLFKEILTDTNLVKIDLYDVGKLMGILFHSF